MCACVFLVCACASARGGWVCLQWVQSLDYLCSFLVVCPCSPVTLSPLRFLFSFSFLWRDIRSAGSSGESERLYEKENVLESHRHMFLVDTHTHCAWGWAVISFCPDHLAESDRSSSPQAVIVLGCVFTPDSQHMKRKQKYQHFFFWWYRLYYKL